MMEAHGQAGTINASGDDRVRTLVCEREGHAYVQVQKHPPHISTQYQSVEVFCTKCGERRWLG